MKILAMDLSTKQGSLALLDGDRVLAVDEWIEAVRGTRTFFTRLEALQNDAGVAWDELDAIAVGRGPGVYSGMRISLITARSLALPSAVPVYALASGEVMAHTLLSEDPDRAHVAVLGDARRHRLWYRIYRKTETGLEGLEEWSLAPLEEAMASMPAGTLAGSPDLDRLQDPLASLPDASFEVYPQPLTPDAASLGRLVMERINRNVESEPLTPLYLHPPVFVAPRFAT